MHTPMLPDGDAFVADVRVPPGTIVDYGFLLTNQVVDAESEVTWDGDYQLVVEDNGIIEHQAKNHLSYSGTSQNRFDARRLMLLIISVAAGIVIVMGIRRVVTSDWRHLHLHRGVFQ
jgi:hypothetical protein